MSTSDILADSDRHQVKMATKADDDALRRRRERGRRSQAGFRKRQAEANQRVKEQNGRLRRAVERLVGATRGDESPELLRSILHVAEAAGVDVDGGAGQHPLQADAARAAQTQTATAGPKPAKHVRTPPAHAEDDVVISATTRDYAASSPQAPSNPPARLACGLWLDDQHYMRISVPPGDIVPYLGAGARTFAGLLFWALMEQVRGDLSRGGGDDNRRDFEVVTARSLTHSRATRGWAVRYVEAMVEARLEFRRTGSISQRLASAAEPDLGFVVRDRVAADYRARGVDPDQVFVSTAGIERRVRGMVGDAAFRVLEAVARGESGKGGDEQSRLYEVVKRRLQDSCICFGDGPRWSVDTVDAIFLDWVHAAFWAAPGSRV
ncbi:hypothetical protein GGR52DRAFT_556318 [Hypoxylon sp. FL1284]|nr:hypothetical protein GGR52DRAFT_556318 [Hypoxylon sp. FL1284]